MLPETQQLNVEWLFLTIYNLLHGGAVDLSALYALVAHIWLWIIWIGYTLSVIAIGVIVYCTIRLFDLRRREEEYLGTLITDPSAQNERHPRWEHIQSLIAGTSVSEWREAISEADIMLDEVLREKGYAGETVSDKLKEAHFHSVDDAWEGHKVRNRIAHDGSVFDLPRSLAERTIARYEAVFREFEVI